MEDRTPPQNSDAEQAVLGSLMLGSPIVHEVAEVLVGSDFYRPAHEQIYDACLALHRDRQTIDPIAVAQRLGREVERIGGAPYLHTLTAGVPVAVNAAYYAELVRKAARSRRLVDAGVRITQLGYQAEDVDFAAEEARRELDTAVEQGTGAEAVMGAAELLSETLDALDGGVDPGLPTGWADLDEVVNGLRPGQLAVVGARPSVGKSVVAANLAAHACKAGVGVHFASLEMTRGEVMNRLLSAHATVGLHRLMNHDLTEDDWQRLARRGNDLHSWPLAVDDTPAQSLLQVRARARSTSRRLPLGLVIVDYLQLMSPRDRRVNREQQVGELSEGLKGLAKELGVPVVALAQLNRGSAERTNKRPMLYDLRESGRIEADADHVWLLHRQDLVDRESATGELEVDVAKNRNGRAGTVVKLLFQGHYSRAVSPAAEPWTPTRGIA